MTAYSMEGDFPRKISLGIVCTSLKKVPCLVRSSNAVSRKQLPSSRPPPLALTVFQLSLLQFSLNLQRRGLI